MTKYHIHLSNQGWSLKDEEREFKNRLCDSGDRGYVGGERERLGMFKEVRDEKKGQRNKYQRVYTICPSLQLTSKTKN